MGAKEHWEAVYGKKLPDAVSWYRPHLDQSLRFIDAAGLSADSPLIDVGGGTSTLVDDLLGRGFSDVTVLDISAGAIRAAQERLGPRAADVTWVVGDITEIGLPEHRYAFWHDRAVFHFLTEPESRRRYVAAVRRALKPNGHIIVATFGPAGPETCSGLPVTRYDAAGIHAQFGGEFAQVGSSRESHLTPRGSEQEFVYCYCRLGPLDAR